MAVTAEFKEAVLKKNLLRVRIMLKDSLLVDTSFKQFDEMIRYAESKLGSTIWIDDQEDDDIFSQSQEGLNNILAGLVNHFSKRRVKYLKGMIKRKYPSKKGEGPKKNKMKGINILKRTGKVEKAYQGIRTEQKNINECISRNSPKLAQKEKTVNIEDIKKIKIAAQEIVNYCNEILGK